MIVAIIDIVSSREITDKKRKKMDKDIRRLLDETHNRFEKYCHATPTLTQGDSIELLVDNWLPIIFVLHSLLLENLELRIGMGTGEIIIHNEKADECDGPIFWNARQALEEIKQAKYMTSSAGFRIDRESSSKEKNTVINTILFLTTILSLTPTQLRYCFHYLWEDKQISEIAEAVKTSKANISNTLSKTPCYLIKKVVSFLDQRNK